MSSLLQTMLATLAALSVAKSVSLDDITGDALTIHMVAHTHDDPGWLITVDQYYIEEVQWIFYTMIPVLEENPLRKFSYVEMAYMSRWWQEIDDELRQQTIDLVKSGQFQINLGGWCMNDEANPTATAVIHQMTDGNQWVLNNLGLVGRPTVAWHVDPFGHSWVTGGLWAQAGFDAFAVHRINYLDLEQRKNDKNLEFMWKGSSSLGEDGYIFMHVLDSGYCTPAEVTFWGGDAWVNTDDMLPSYPANQMEIAEELIRDARERSAWYKHDQLLIPFGCDFAHQNAYQSMLQMDKVMAYINGNNTYNVTIKFSSVADYVAEVNQLNLTWPLEQPDFFTYVDSPHAWWSGYFTSRPLLKLYARSRENVLRVAEQFYLYATNLGLRADLQTAMSNITFLRAAINVAQHHDAISGTEKTAVFDEYMYRMANGTEKVDAFMESVVGQFLKGASGKEPTLSREPGTLLSQLSGSQSVVLVAYNSLAWNITQCLQVPTNRSDLVVVDRHLNVVPSQINPVADQEQNAAFPAKYNLFILAKNLKPLAFETFFIKIATADRPAALGQVVVVESGESFKAGKGAYSVTIDGETNRLSTITNNEVGITRSVENQFSQYTPNGGDYGDGGPTSGAYLFRPATDYRVTLDTSQQSSVVNQIVFRQPFNNPSSAQPVVIAQPHANQQFSQDTFGANICSYDLKADAPFFKYQYYQVGRVGWTQQPLFDFLVFDANDASYNALTVGQQVGVVTVSPTADSNDKQVEITFPKQFANTPLVFTSVLGGCDGDGSQFAVTILSIGGVSATVAVRKLNGDWTDAIQLNWYAFDPTIQTPSELQRMDSFSVTIPASNAAKVQNVSIAIAGAANDAFFVHEPVVLTSVQLISSPAYMVYFASTTYMNNNATFNLNLYPIASPGNAQQITLLVHYIAVQAKALVSTVSDDNAIKNVLVTGDLIDEVQQTFRAGYGQTYRLFNVLDADLRFIDNRVQIGQIDEGAEFVTRYSTALNSGGVMYTNQAGLEYVPRAFNPFWDEPIAGNFFPSSGQSYIEDAEQDVRFSTIVNQGHGVSSLQNGQMELMLQRRCLEDDHRGVAEVLNTTFHTEPQIMIVLDRKENTANLNRRLYQIQQFEHSFFYGLTDSVAEYTSQYATTWTAMHKNMAAQGLPESVFLMQLRYGYSGQGVGENAAMILALQHMLELNESSMAKPVSLDLQSIFNTSVLTVQNSTEMNLLATIALSDMQRLSWHVQLEDGEVVNIRDESSEHKRRQTYKENDEMVSSTIELAPRQIRTFVLNVEPDRPKSALQR